MGLECSRGWAWKVLGYVGFESACVCGGGKGLRMWVWKVLGKFEVVWAWKGVRGLERSRVRGRGKVVAGTWVMDRLMGDRYLFGNVEGV